MGRFFDKLFELMMDAFPAVIAIAVFIGIPTLIIFAGVADGKKKAAAIKKSPALAHSKTGQVLFGRHDLKEIEVKDKKNVYFTIQGEGKNTTISFQWKTNDGSYAFNRMPLSRVKFEDKYETPPEIRFKWREGRITDMDTIFAKHVIGAIITCEDEHWKPIQDKFFGVNKKGEEKESE